MEYKDLPSMESFFQAAVTDKMGTPNEVSIKLRTLKEVITRLENENVSKDNIDKWAFEAYKMTNEFTHLPTSEKKSPTIFISEPDMSYLRVLVKDSMEVPFESLPRYLKDYDIFCLCFLKAMCILRLKHGI